MASSESGDALGVSLMRWIARLVAIPWAYCALGLVWFIAGVGLEEGMPLALNIAIVFTAFCLTLGAAILAGVWKMEAFGGKVLVADCVLVFVWCAVTPQLPGGAFLALGLPPLLAGALFLACHSQSRGDGTVHVATEASSSGAGVVENRADADRQS